MAFDIFLLEVILSGLMTGVMYALVALGFVHNRPSDESCAAREMPMPPALRGFPRAASKVQLPASSIHV